MSAAAVARALLPLALAVAAPASAQRVSVRAGRIVYTPAAGARARVLTATGRDTLPLLSPDGRLVAFVRRAPGDTVETGSGWAERTDVMVVKTDGTGERLLVRGRRGAHARTEAAIQDSVAGVWKLAFSLDGRTVFAMSDAWANSHALHAVDVATARHRFLCDARDVAVIPRGRHRGMLLRWWHRVHSDGMRDEVWVVTPACRPVRIVADEDWPDAARRIAAARAGRFGRR